MKNSVRTGLLFILILSSCGEYEKLLKSSDYQLKYDKAFEYFEKEDYVRAATLFEQISNVYRGTVKADTLSFYRAMSYYNQRDYVMASHYFQEMASTYPNSDFSEEAVYLRAYCFYKLSPRPSLDQENTYKAINAFTLYMINYPETDKKELCMGLIAEMREKLVEKSFINARLYFERGNYKAAIVALTNSLNEFPDTKYREQLLFLILRSNYLLADNSIESKKKERFQATLDEYYSFVGEYNESEFSAEAKRMYENSMKNLGQEIK